MELILTQIKDLPVLERPREKALRFGISHLSDIELLALIIGSGTSGHSAIDIAHNIILDKKGLFNTFHTPYQDFTKYLGLSNTSAIKLVAAFELGKRYQVSALERNVPIVDEFFIYQKYAPLLRGLTQEKIAIIILNHRKNIIFEQILSIGSENNVSCSIRDILRLLIINKGSSFYLVHNHPNDAVEPSQQDIIFTTCILQEAKKIGLRLIDHLIIGETDGYSFQKDKLLSQISREIATK